MIEGECDSFEVQYTDEDGQLNVATVGGDQGDVTLTGLESGHRYLVTLYGYWDGQRVGLGRIEAHTGQPGNAVSFISAGQSLGQGEQGRPGQLTFQVLSFSMSWSSRTGGGGSAFRTYHYNP